MLSPSKTENWDVHTTTILAGVIVQTDIGSWELACVSVGDCKVHSLQGILSMDSNQIAVVCV